ncbi:putative glycosyltransferase [Arthrobacter globiformis NBRC 12137]|uniref:Putative glycosyltransferase n=1 Tax=Arthrobacter globiformis (strain ATCC 8010 / DSM 20124 / JCM 1332 / NBRC 12137 / NCIMB 8907 / NRRL B-2979 / 168) TaxID=1077972 RepID=H0QN61_ARTG1|nr:glycosyltransferase family 4 protein [Arthrobacter globiformis]GAB14262.1 putative glycosyltransferase [Arthrobacter globiformis NBRC 12137]
MQPSEPVTAYVLKMYPRFSETFIVSEILAREAAGERIEIFALRPTTDARFHPELARVKAPVTYVGRPQSTSGVWESLRAAASAGLTDGVSQALGELAAADPDDAVQAINLAAELQRRNVRHLHAHFASAATAVARLASLITGIPYSFTAHAADIFRDTVNREDLRTKLADAHHVVTISDYNLQYLRHHFPQQAERLRLVRNGLELARFPYRDPRPVGTTVRVAAVGRLVEKKGFQHLLPALASLIGSGVRADVRIAGTGMMANELQSALEQLGLSRHVRMLGPQTQDQIHELLDWADVFVAPCIVGSDGNADGIPTVLLEAMATGTPCVSTAVTGIPEVIRDGSTGLLVEPGDPALLVQAILRITSPATDRTLLARNARTLIEREYDAGRQAAALRRLSLQTVAQRPLSPAPEAVA